MYTSKFNKTMPKDNEDILDVTVLTVSGIDFFCLDEDRVVINDRSYSSRGMTINTLKHTIEGDGGTVSVNNSNYLTYPVAVLGNYSNWTIVRTTGSPVNLDQISYRYTDIAYSYSALTDATIINDKILSSTSLKNMILKKASTFRLMTVSEDYVGI